MAEYIDRQAAINACLDGWNKGYEEILADIRALPSADVVPVVRCRDCKNAVSWYGRKLRCFLWSNTGNGVFEDGFCSYGARMDGEQDG